MGLTAGDRHQASENGSQPNRANILLTFLALPEITHFQRHEDTKKILRRKESRRNNERAEMDRRLPRQHWKPPKLLHGLLGVLSIKVMDLELVLFVLPGKSKEDVRILNGPFYQVDQVANAQGGWLGGIVTAE